MTIRAHIAQGFWSDVVVAYIVDHREGQHRLLKMEGENWTWTDWEDDGVTSADEQPSVVLPYDSGRALLEALVTHYQGAEDTRALRRDYDSERKRVDEQSKVIADIARTLAGRSVI